jgi:hypothetical protein
LRITLSNTPYTFLHGGFCGGKLKTDISGLKKSSKAFDKLLGAQCVDIESRANIGTNQARSSHIRTGLLSQKISR